MSRRAGTIAGITLVTLLMCVSGDQRQAKGATSELPARRSAAVPHLQLHAARQYKSDLEIAGMVDGLAPQAAGYVRLADLLSLPQVSIPASDDENFAGESQGATITGVTLEELALSLGVLRSSDLVEAECVDRYRAHYPASYIAVHHPVLGLRVDGQDPDDWARLKKRRSAGRYFITHAEFKPAFVVLKHADEAQVPTGVIRLHYTTTAATFGAIAPVRTKTTRASQDGFVIARQNCLRCHNQGVYGGTKAGVDWRLLSMLAQQQTAFFEKYVSNPKSVAVEARMPANPAYDQATLHAITEYFQSAREAASAKESSVGHE